MEVPDTGEKVVEDGDKGSTTVLQIQLQESAVETGLDRGFIFGGGV